MPVLASISREGCRSAAVAVLVFTVTTLDNASPYRSDAKLRRDETRPLRGRENRRKKGPRGAGRSQLALASALALDAGMCAGFTRRARSAIFATAALPPSSGRTSSCWSSETLAYSAKPPLLISANTSSPGRNRVTPVLSASTGHRFSSQFVRTHASHLSARLASTVLARGGKGNHGIGTLARATSVRFLVGRGFGLANDCAAVRCWPLHCDLRAAISAA